MSLINSFFFPSSMKEHGNKTGGHILLFLMYVRKLHCKPGSFHSHRAALLWAARQARSGLPRNSVTNSTISPVKYNTKWHSLRRSANKWGNKWRCECVHSFPHHLSIPLSTQALACTIWDSIAYTIQWYYPQNYTNLLRHAKWNNMTVCGGTSLFSYLTNLSSSRKLNISNVRFPPTS